MAPYFFYQTQGKNQKNNFVRFFFKWEQENLLLKFIDIQDRLKTKGTIPKVCCKEDRFQTTVYENFFAYLMT